LYWNSVYVQVETSYYAPPDIFFEFKLSNPMPAKKADIAAKPAVRPHFEAPRAHVGLAADARGGLSINIERTGKANGNHSKSALA
jgi:hypothetical protein